MKRAAAIALMLAWHACCVAQVDLQRERVIQAAEAFVTPEEDLVLRAQAPAAGADECLVLELQQRLAVPGGGGCNWVLGVSINDRVLSESVTRPRLLNKPGAFGLTGTSLQFDWYSRTYRAWMTLFSPDYDKDLASGDDDYRFLWDITGYAEPGEELRLRLSYAQKGIPAALKREAPLAVRNVLLGVLDLREVERLRLAAQTGGQPPPGRRGGEHAAARGAAGPAGV